MHPLIHVYDLSTMYTYMCMYMYTCICLSGLYVYFNITDKCYIHLLYKTNSSSIFMKIEYIYMGWICNLVINGMAISHMKYKCNTWQSPLQEMH